MEKEKVTMKSKAFNLPEEQIKELNAIIDKSGKQHNEFMVDLIQELKMKEVAQNEAAISPDLRKHFESDVAKLKNATQSIIHTFISQMENISVEKNRWEKKFSYEVSVKEEAIAVQKEELNTLRDECQGIKENSLELEKELEGKDKAADLCEKRLSDQEHLIKNYQEKIEEMSRTIDDQSNIVKQMKIEVAEKEKYAEQVNQLTVEIQRMNEQHENEIGVLKERLSFESEKAINRKEQELHDYYRAKESQLRESVRKETTEELREFYHNEYKEREIDLNQRLKDQLDKTIALEEKILELKAKNKQKTKRTTTPRKKKSDKPV